MVFSGPPLGVQSRSLERRAFQVTGETARPPPGKPFGGCLAVATFRMTANAAAEPRTLALAGCLERCVFHEPIGRNDGPAIV